MRTNVPKYYFDLNSESQIKVEELSKKICDLLAKENLSYKEAVTTLELAQEELKEHKII